MTLPTPPDDEIRGDVRPLEAAERALKAASGQRYVYVNAIVDMRRCSGCNWVYGFSPFRSWKEDTNVARLRYGEIKWCPKCEEPHKVLLMPMWWRNAPVAPFRYVDYAESLELADTLGLGLSQKEKPDVRSIAERMKAIGLEVAA